MFLSIFKIMIVAFYVNLMDSIPISSPRCSPTTLGCLCQDMEHITEKEIEPCCSKMMATLTITGYLTKNISIDIVASKCASNFVNLVIRETGIEKFYSSFNGLSNVSYVYIERNQNLSDFHKLVFREINLDILNINIELNSFRIISNRTFANLSNLNTLKLSDNKIGYIEDQSFAGLKNLNLLYMNNNILTLLSSEVFYGLDSLTVLSLFNNPLQEPKSSNIFVHLKNLRYLAMSQGNHVALPGISQLPQNVFFTIKQLKTLNMTSIRLETLNSLTFYGLKELEHLDLQGNRLTLIPSGTLQQVSKIGSINLSRNQLNCLLSDTFQNLPKLVNLDLSYNELSYISEDVFKDLPRLKTLDLAENNIYVIERNAFAGLSSLMIIKLNLIHGLAKNEIQTKFRLSSLAKLRNTTKIVGLMYYFGISKGMNQPPEVPKNISNGSSKTTERLKMPCPVASSSDKDWVDVSVTGSRKYLLIIIGICVMFLLIAFAIIMTYRAWSKRRLGDLSLDVKCDEKQEMMQSKNYAINGRIEKSGSKSNHHSRKSINDRSSHDPNTRERTTDSNSHLQRHSNSQTTAATKLPLSDANSHSDDESALTPLGIL